MTSHNSPKEQSSIAEHETKVRALQDALSVGEQSGTPRPFDSEAFLSRLHAKHAAKQSK